MKDEYYMREAIKEAQKAYEKGEVPIGSIVVFDGKIIGRGHNNVENSNHSFEHAEIVAIKQAEDYIGDWRLEKATLYTTLEPCVMCAGAIVHSRIEKLVYGGSDFQRGFAGSILNIVDDKLFNHRVKVTSGICEKECVYLINEFFKKRREENSRLR